MQPNYSDKENNLRSDDSTISVNENIKKKLRQKVDRYKQHSRKNSSKTRIS